MLHASDYQNIVDRVIGILGKNINIMDTGGNIIASGDESRIGAFHEIAAVAAAENREIIVDADHINEFIGVKPGINLPINFSGEVVGVVGITGSPEEVTGYGKIIKELVELMVQDKQQKKIELFQYRALRDYVKELIKSPVSEPDEITHLENRASLVGFDLKIEKDLIMTDIVGFSAFIAKNTLKEVQIQGIKQSITEILQYGSGSQDVVFNLGADRFLIIKQSLKDVQEFCQNKRLRIQNRLNISLTFASGGICKSLTDYYGAYTTASQLLDISAKLRNIEFVSKNDFLLHLLLNSMPEKSKLDYLAVYDEMFFGDKNLNLETIKVFFESGMNIKSTVEKLFIHKNTLLYRLNKFKDNYGLDPLNSYHCMKIYIGILLNELRDK